MNYCLISDAWGNDIEHFTNNIDTKNNELDNKDNLKTQSNTFNNTVNNTVNNEEHFIKSNPNFSYDNINCNDIMLHINNCKVCQQLLKNRYNIIDNLCVSIDRNRDVIILILISISILLFINLLNNLVRN
jgi:hypothetical protein